MIEPKIRVVLVDDCPSSLELLDDILHKHAIVKILNSFTNPHSALEYIEHFQPDIAFVDIEIPEKSGLDLIKELYRRPVNTQFVLVTAYSQYAIPAIKLNVFDYIVKPICLEDVTACINKFIEWRKQSSLKDRIQKLVDHIDSGSIRLNTRTGFLILELDKILYCKAECNYTEFFLINGQKETASLNLGVIESMIEKPWFIRASRSVIINTKYFIGIDRKRKTCILQNGHDKTYVSLPLEKLRELEKIFY
jgi:two-component system, LytTR family, response regulator